MPASKTIIREGHLADIRPVMRRAHGGRHRLRNLNPDCTSYEISHRHGQSDRRGGVSAAHPPARDVNGFAPHRILFKGGRINYTDAMKIVITSQNAPGSWSALLKHVERTVSRPQDKGGALRRVYAGRTAPLSAVAVNPRKKFNE